VLPFEPLSSRLSVDNLAADLAEPRLAPSDLRLTRSTAAVDEWATAMGPNRARHAHERPELSTGLADDAAEDSGFRLSVRFPTAIDPPYRLLAESLPVSCPVPPCVFHWCSPPSIPAVAPASTGCCGFTGPGPSTALDGHGKVSPWPAGYVFDATEAGKGGILGVGEGGDRFRVALSDLRALRAARLLPRRHVAACDDVLITPSGEGDDAHGAG
jgi:hypothetical protein